MDGVAFYHVGTGAMALLLQQSGIRIPVVASAFVCAVLLCQIAGVQAEIIVDDFDDGFEIELPEDVSVGFELQQPGIGSLAAERWSRVAALSTDPIGQVDADVSRISSLSINVNELAPKASGTSLTSVAASLIYFIDETDVTENGLNDRFVIDFDFLQGAIPLSRLDVFLQDAANPGISYVSQMLDIPMRDGPFVLDFPFTSFSVRGGGPGQVDLQRVNRVSVSIFPVRTFSFTGPTNINFSTAVDRLRFANAVPETDACILVLACLVFAKFGVYSRRCKS